MFEKELAVLRAVHAIPGISSLGQIITLVERLSAGHATEKGLQGITKNLKLFSGLGEVVTEHSLDEIWPTDLIADTVDALEVLHNNVRMMVYDHRMSYFLEAAKIFWQGQPNIVVPPMPKIDPYLLEFLATSPSKGFGWNVLYIPEQFVLSEVVQSDLFTHHKDKDRMNADSLKYGEPCPESFSDKPKTLSSRTGFLPSRSEPGWYAIESELALTLKMEKDQLKRWTGLRRRESRKYGLSFDQLFYNVADKLAHFLQIPQYAIVLPSVEELLLCVPYEKLGGFTEPELTRNRAEGCSPEAGNFKTAGVVLDSEFALAGKPSNSPFSLSHAETFRSGPWVSRLMIRLDDCIGYAFQKPVKPLDFDMLDSM